MPGEAYDVSAEQRARHDRKHSGSSSERLSDQITAAQVSYNPAGGASGVAVDGGGMSKAISEEQLTSRHQQQQVATATRGRHKKRLSAPQVGPVAPLARRPGRRTWVRPSVMWSRKRRRRKSRSLERSSGWRAARLRSSSTPGRRLSVNTRSSFVSSAVRAPRARASRTRSSGSRASSFRPYILQRDRPS